MILSSIFYAYVNISSVLGQKFSLTHIWCGKTFKIFKNRSFFAWPTFVFRKIIQFCFWWCIFSLKWRVGYEHNNKLTSGLARNEWDFKKINLTACLNDLWRCYATIKKHESNFTMYICILRTKVLLRWYVFYRIGYNRVPLCPKETRSM